MSTTLEYLPIWRVRDLSFAAKMTWLAFHAGIPVPDTAWRDYLSKMGQPYVPKEACLAELEVSGWLA